MTSASPPALSASTADLRALAATRIGVALIVLYDLLTRVLDFRAHYTEAGVLPLAEVPADPLFGNGALSLHLLSTSSLAQGLLFAAAFLAAGALLVGHHTRRATWVSWWLLISLHARNPHVIYEADVMLALLLAWGGLLPWGRRWSLDARGRRAPTRVTSPAVLGLRLQMSMALLCAYLCKTGETWYDGSAVGYALQLDVYSNAFGRWIESINGASALLTRGTLLLELVGPLLVFVPQHRLRWVGIALLASLQLGFGLTMSLGIFPAVFLVALIPFVPTRAPRVVRDRRPLVGALACALVLLSAFINASYLVGERAYEADPAQELKAYEAAYENPEAQPAPAVRLELRSLEWIARVLHVDQAWGMFAPDPMTDDGWYAIPARVGDGRMIDLLQGRELSWEKPESVSDHFGGDRWKELIMASHDEADGGTLWRRIVEHFADRWDAAHPAAPVRYARLVFMGETTLPTGEAEPVEETLCSWRRQ